MNKVSRTLNVFYEDPFWVGIFEERDHQKFSVCKVTFGVEPNSSEIYQFILEHDFELKFSETLTTGVKEQKKNPKRQQREIQKQVKEIGIGTKAQQALKLQYEQFKQEHKQISKEQKEAEKQLKFELRQQKKKKKHRGR